MLLLRRCSGFILQRSAPQASRAAVRSLHSVSHDFDFDTLPDRSNKGQLKWDKYAGRDIVPLWVADMDFKTCPAIKEALHARIDQDVFGYTLPTDEVVAAVTEYLTAQGLTVEDKEHILFAPAAVQTLNLVCKLIPPGAGVMVFTPVYPPFLQAPEHTGRELVSIPLTRAPVPAAAAAATAAHGSDQQQQSEEQWTFDFEAMAAAVAERPDIGLLILCSPHNPVGRVFTPAELSALGEFCRTHGMLICSDEIHCDLVLSTGVQHVPMAAVDGGRFADITITVNAPSKTYNVPGLGCSYALVTDKALRRRLLAASRGIITQNPTLGYTGCAAAYSTAGYAWRSALLDYLRGNRDLVYSRIAETMPELRMWPMQATYLAWIDARALQWRDPVLEFENAGVGLTDGRFFAQQGFVRLNFGLPRWRLQQGLDRMTAAVQARRAELAEKALQQQRQ